MERIEHLILRSLLYNSDFAPKAYPFIDAEYFSDETEKTLFLTYKELLDKYRSVPSKEAIILTLGEKQGLKQNVVDGVGSLISELEKHKENKVDPQWLVDATEKFCQDKAIYNAIMESIQIIDSKHKSLTVNSIPDLLKRALGVSFDTNIGHDYLADYEDRYKEYHKKENKIPFDLRMLNDITGGGIPPKTLNILAANTGGFKSGTLCHFAAGYLSRGHNVLYITAEMSEAKIAERIDANLMNIPLDDLKVLPEGIFTKKVETIKSKTVGKLIIKEYPTATAHTGHFRHLIDELHLKKNFVPQILIVDYLNICTSARFKMGSNVNSYTYVKAIAEELRGLAVEKNLRCWSATQLNRQAINSSDVDLSNTSESMGLPHTADFMLALISSEELEELNQIMFKQLKNRYSDDSHNRRFVVGIDKSKMKLYDVENATAGVVASERKQEKSTQSVLPRVDSSNRFSGIKV